jgi:hypothetical protein
VIRPARGAAVGTLLLSALLPAACGGHSGGDPGGRRLMELSSDPVFAVRAPGATNLHVERIPARYVHPAYQSAGWDGPTVIVSFESSAEPAQVYRFYARRAAGAGWRAGASVRSASRTGGTRPIPTAPRRR